jgi:hypothetical protein
MQAAVLSGDTVIVRSKEAQEKGKPLKERSLHIAGLSAPRMGSTAREDEVSVLLPAASRPLAHKRSRSPSHLASI